MNVQITVWLSPASIDDGLAGVDVSLVNVDTGTVYGPATTQLQPAPGYDGPGGPDRMVAAITVPAGARYLYAIEGGAHSIPAQYSINDSDFVGLQPVAGNRAEAFAHLGLDLTDPGWGATTDVWAYCAYPSDLLFPPEVALGSVYVIDNESDWNELGPDLYTVDVVDATTGDVISAGREATDALMTAADYQEPGFFRLAIPRDGTVFQVRITRVADSLVSYLPTQANAATGQGVPADDPNAALLIFDDSKSTGSGFRAMYYGGTPGESLMEEIADSTSTWGAAGVGGVDPPPTPTPRSTVLHRSEPQVWTATPDSAGSDRIYLDQLGAVSGLRYSHQFPGGCKDLACQLAVPPEFSHRALTPGRDIGVTAGAEDTWLGTLNAPTVGDDGRRQITADGDAVAAARFAALGLGTHNALNANEVVDAAQLSGRHSRFRRVDTFPVPDGQRADDGAFMMDEALTQAANAAGKRWRIDLDRVVRMYPYAGDGRRLLLHARQDIGRTLDGFVTRLDAAFIDSATGLFRVEHMDAPASDTGSTYYPAFYTPDGSAYAAGGFTLYTDGSTITAYAIGKPTTATVLSLSSPAVDLALVETSQFYSRFTAAASLAPGATGRTATYRASTGGPSLGSGAQEGIAHRGTGSLQATGNIPPREAVVDLTGQGAFTQAQALAQLREHLGRAKSQPHYDGSWTADMGDLLNTGGVPVDLATVRAGVQLAVLAVDSTRNLSLQSDDVLVTIGETDYDADTGTLRLTPDSSPDRPALEPTVDFATGLVR